MDNHNNYPKSKTKNPSKTVASPARRLAYESLMRISSDGRYSNIEVDTSLRRDSLTPQDSALYTALVYGVLERRVTLDHIIAELSSRPLSSIDGDAKCALYLGLYQLLYMDKIPSHAAVSESVALVTTGAGGFVNALLRSFLRRNCKYTMPPVGTMMYYSVKYSLPTPIFDLWRAAYGEETAVSLAEYTVRRPRLCLRVNTLFTNAERIQKAFAEKGIESRISDFTDDVLILPRSGGVPDRREFFVQDESSRIAVKLLGCAPGMTVIDTCAAPGGKSLSAALDMKNEGKIYSFDLHENKLNLIRSSANRLGISIIEADQCDGAHPKPSLFGKADRVICDAPCSGLGVIAKKPEIKYKDPAAFLRLPEIQYRLLDESSKYCRPGGTVMYSTCTLNPAENEDVARKFVALHPEFTPLDFQVGERYSSDGMYTFMPHRDGTDGFFAALFKRNDE